MHLKIRLCFHVLLEQEQNAGNLTFIVILTVKLIWALTHRFSQNEIMYSKFYSACLLNRKREK